MKRDQLLACTKKRLTEIARAAGIRGWHGMTKDQLVQALAAQPAGSSRRAAPPDAKALPGKARPRIQVAAARNTSASAEEQVESSKYDVGVPTSDLSAKVPKD